MNIANDALCKVKVVECIWEDVAKAMNPFSSSELSWLASEPEAKRAVIAVLRALSEIELPPDVLASVKEARPMIYGPAYRAINKAFLDVALRSDEVVKRGECKAENGVQRNGE